MTLTSAISSADSLDPLDFSYLDQLTQVQAGQGRLFLGQAAEANLNRPVMTFVHGGYMGAWCFSTYLAYFDSLGIAAAAIDCRGHGGLAQDADFIRAKVSDFASDVAAACDQLSGPPVLVGHSLGALIVGSALRQRSVAGLGLLAPSPPGQLKGAHRVPLLPETLLAMPADSFEPKVRAASDSRDIEPVIERLCGESPVALNDRYGLRVAVWPQSPAVPAICIAAGHDDPVRHPPDQDRATAEHFGADFYLLERAPHCFMLAEDWIESAEILEAWYRENFQYGV